jgi:hypothetical protein
LELGIAAVDFDGLGVDVDLHSIYFDFYNYSERSNEPSLL